MGRIATDIEVRQAQAHTVASFTIAVPRRMKKEETDFIRCIAWNNTGDFISRYFHKGRMIALEGELQTRTWTGQDGNKRYSTEVNVDNVYFTGEKAQDAPAVVEQEPMEYEFADIDDSDCPF